MSPSTAAANGAKKFATSVKNWELPAVSRFALIVAVVVFAVPAFADRETHDDESHEDRVNYMSDVFKKLPLPSERKSLQCDGCSLAGRDTMDEKDCREMYNPLLSKPVIKMDISMGYSDFGRVIDDPLEHLAWAEFFQKPCPESNSNGACGFKRDADDADLFVKEVKWPGGNKRVELRMYSSSISTDSRLSRGSPAQKLASEAAEKKFHKALRESDLVYYSGHSRFGGGPDFSPPQFKQTADAVTGKPRWRYDLEHYRGQTPGLNKMLNVLKERKNPLFMLGMVSCESRSHFHGHINNSHKVRRSVLSQVDIDDYDGRIAVIASMDSVLNLDCDKRLGQDGTNFRAYDMRGRTTLPVAQYRPPPPQTLQTVKPKPPGDGKKPAASAQAPQPQRLSRGQTAGARGSQTQPAARPRAGQTQGAQSRGGQPLNIAPKTANPFPRPRGAPPAAQPAPQIEFSNNPNSINFGYRPTVAPDPQPPAQQQGVRPRTAPPAPGTRVPPR
jgi:hypothetical protein